MIYDWYVVLTQIGSTRRNEDERKGCLVYSSNAQSSDNSETDSGKVHAISNGKCTYKFLFRKKIINFYLCIYISVLHTNLKELRAILFEKWKKENKIRTKCSSFAPFTQSKLFTLYLFFNLIYLLIRKNGWLKIISMPCNTFAFYF